MAGTVKHYVVGFLVVVLGCAAGAPLDEPESFDDEREMVQCLQPDGPCRCFTNYGLVDLSPVEIGHDIPRYNLLNTSPPGMDNFTYSPCSGFSQGPSNNSDCTDVLVCHLSSDNVYSGLGDADSVVWNTNKMENQLYLNYVHTGSDLVSRYAQVFLICDEGREEDTLVANGEMSPNIYTFQLLSRHACPVSLATTSLPPVYCIETLGPCECLTNEGVIDLSGVEEGQPIPRYDMVDSPDENDRFSYSPCTGFTQPQTKRLQGQGQTKFSDHGPAKSLNGVTNETASLDVWYDCNNVLVCQNHEIDRPDGGDFWGLGDVNGVTWTNNPDAEGAVMLSYRHLGSDWTYRSSEVTLICDEDQEEDILIVHGEVEDSLFKFDLISSHACPRPPITTPPMSTPEPALTCLEPVGPCMCHTDKGIVDLAPLEESSPIPSFNLVGTTPPGVDRFSYSPCTSFNQGPITFIPDPPYYDCTDVLLCQNHEFDRPDEGDFWGVGNAEEIIWANDPQADGALMLKYQHTGFDDTVRLSEITLICNEEGPDTLIAYGEVQQNLFKFDLVSRYACPREELPTTPPVTLPPPILCLEEQGPCSCLTDQGLIDLSPVEAGYDVPRFDLIDTAPISPAQYSYSPCSHFYQGGDGGVLSDCTDVLACQWSRTADLPSGGQFYGLGRNDSVTWVNDPDNYNALVLQYGQVGAHDGIYRTARVTLVCDEDLSVDTLIAFGETDLVYNFHLISRHACPQPEDDSGSVGSNQ